VNGCGGKEAEKRLKGAGTEHYCGGSAVLFRTNPIQAIYRLLAATAIHGVYNLFMVARPADHYISLPQILAVLIALSALITSIVTIRGGMGDST
jgi:hypothetical protein